ncbi:MAG TPA: hypothetical protein VGQ53_09245 [Chitinophagaceae bacterium]|nr:hypothetical protein [Chitinophagaceae bacterium]
MKKTNQMFKTILAIAGIIIFVACTKDRGMISRIGTNYTGGTGTADSIATKKTPGYTGGTGTSDSTATKIGY